MFDTFTQVEKHYNSVKPVISKNHTREQDVRPLGKRTIRMLMALHLKRDLFADVEHGYDATAETFRFSPPTPSIVRQRFNAEMNRTFGLVVKKEVDF